MEKIGILALQGNYNAHQHKISSLGYKSVLVRTRTELNKVGTLILPGGESTAITYLLKKSNLWEDLRKITLRIPTLATCAGAIILSDLGVLDIGITRNGYGSQLASGAFPVETTSYGQGSVISGIFIRAPIIDRVNDSSIKVIGTYKSKPVLIHKNNILASTFHPELSSDSFVYRVFLTTIMSRA